MAIPRRPARILTAYYMPKPGGLCKRYFRAIRALLADGHIVHYLAVRRFPIDHPNCHYHRLWWPGSILPKGALFWVWLHFASVPVLAWLALRYRITHAFAFSINYGAMLCVARLLRRPTFTVFLRADSLRNNAIHGVGMMLRWLEGRVEYLALRRAHVFTVSEALAETVVRRHSRRLSAAFHVLRNDVDTPRLCDAGAEDRVPRRLGFVGIIEQRKNPRLVVDLMAGLVDEGCDVTCMMFGDGPMRESIVDDVERHGLAGRVVLRGWCDASDIWSVIDVLIHPAIHEGAPNAVIEALGNGCLTLASDIPEHREILPEETLCPLHDRDEWIARVRRLIEDRRWRDLTARSLADATDRLRFDWDAAVRGAILAPIDASSNGLTTPHRHLEAPAGRPVT